MPVEHPTTLGEGPKDRALTEKQKHDLLSRLPKRLAYVLRYGAVKEGLTVHDNGFVPLDDINQVQLLSAYTRDEILHEVHSSVSYRHTKRFESRDKNGRTEIRATYLRRFEPNPNHHGTNVKTLLETAMLHVINNLDDYDLQDFPDEDIIKRMFHRLKREKKLTVRALQAILVPSLTAIDMEGVLITNNTLRILRTQCPNLRRISLKGCGYIITDNVLSQLAKSWPNLEHLNLCQCNHLTSQCLNILAKRLPRLSMLHAAGVPSLTFDAVLDFLTKATALTFLDIYYMRYSAEEYTFLTQTATSNGVKLVLREPRDLRSRSNGADDRQDELEEDVMSTLSEEVDGDVAEANALTYWESLMAPLYADDFEFNMDEGEDRDQGENEGEDWK